MVVFISIGVVVFIRSGVVVFIGVGLIVLVLAGVFVLVVARVVVLVGARVIVLFVAGVVVAVVASGSEEILTDMVVALVILEVREEVVVPVCLGIKKIHHVILCCPNLYCNNYHVSITSELFYQFIGLEMSSACVFVF